MLPSSPVPLQPHHGNHLFHRLNRLMSAPHLHAPCEPPALPQTGEGGIAPIGLLGRGADNVRNVLRCVWRVGGEQPSPASLWLSSNELWQTLCWGDGACAHREGSECRLWHTCHRFATTALQFTIPTFGLPNLSNTSLEQSILFLDGTCYLMPD